MGERHHDLSFYMPPLNDIVHKSASGFIGLPAAQALSRAGHIVYGLTRFEEKAKLLAADESKLTQLHDTAQAN